MCNKRLDDNHNPSSLNQLLPSPASDLITLSINPLSKVGSSPFPSLRRVLPPLATWPVFTPRLHIYSCGRLSSLSFSAACDNTTATDSPPHHSEKIMNQIDACWRSNPGWASDRERLADCAVGFGRGALGGKNGAIYTVTDPSDDGADPKLVTLRYGAIQTQPLWIVFKEDMVIRLENELIVNSFKTIDGRGAKVEIANGPCIRIQQVNHVITHRLC